MIRRTTWVLVFVFVVLIGLTIFLQRREVSKPLEPSPTPEISLLEMNEGDILKLSIEGNDTDLIEFELDESGQWALTEPAGGAVDSSIVNSVLSRLVTLKIVATIDPLPDFEVLGLANPDNKIRLATKHGTGTEIIVGNVTTTGSGYYVKLGDDKVFVVSISGIDTVTNLLENPPFLPTPTTELETSGTTTP